MLPVGYAMSYIEKDIRNDYPCSLVASKDWCVTIWIRQHKAYAYSMKSLHSTKNG